MCDVDSGTGLTWLSIGSGGGNYKCGSEPFGFKNCREFPEG